MTLRELALGWNVDGTVGAAFLALLACIGSGYLAAAARGARRDRRGRRWPRHRIACFLSGLSVLAVDLYSGIGAEADVRLSAHMVEHMVLWLVVAPLLVAGAPVRLAFYALGREGRRTLARALHSPAVRAATSPLGSVALFSAVLLISHVPAVYGLALGNQYIHEAEHALYLLTALLLWAPILGFDPLPHRPGPGGRLACMAACMVPMAMISIWLASSTTPVYGHYLGTLGPAALADQREAAAIMWLGGLPAFALIPLAARRPRRRPSPAPSLAGPATPAGKAATIGS